MTRPALSHRTTPMPRGLLRWLKLALPLARLRRGQPHAHGEALHDEALYARSLLARHGKLD